MASDEGVLKMDVSFEYEACRGEVLEFFKSDEPFAICSPNVDLDFDGALARYLVSKGHENWLVNDVSYGYVVGGLAERVLCDMVENREVLESSKGKITVKENYTFNSARYFQAWRAE